MPLDVLLVEDNALNRELATDLLEGAGHRVCVAVNATAFRSLLRERAPMDIILMDIRLPDANGLDLLREVQESALSTVPVVAITAHALSGDRERLQAAGFLAVITKPINTRTFVAEIERLARVRPGR